MYLFRYPDYQSEATQFLQKLKAEKPSLEEQQRTGRSLLWDKNVDRQAWDEFKAARVPQKPYVYQTGPAGTE